MQLFNLVNLGGQPLTYDILYRKKGECCGYQELILKGAGSRNDAPGLWFNVENGPSGIFSVFPVRSQRLRDRRCKSDLRYLSCPWDSCASSVFGTQNSSKQSEKTGFVIRMRCPDIRLYRML